MWLLAKVGGFVGASAFALLVLLCFLTGTATGFVARVAQLLGRAFRQGYRRGVSWKTGVSG